MVSLAAWCYLRSLRRKFSASNDRLPYSYLSLVLTSYKKASVLNGCQDSFPPHGLATSAAIPASPISSASRSAEPANISGIGPLVAHITAPR